LRDDYNGLGRYGTVGLELILSIIFGFVAGRWLDQKFHAGGLLTLVGFFFGVIAGFRALYVAAQRMRIETERADERERKQREGHGDHDHDDSE
jgi:ATP synthase protein I